MYMKDFGSMKCLYVVSPFAIAFFVINFSAIASRSKFLLGFYSYKYIFISV